MRGMRPLLLLTALAALAASEGPRVLCTTFPMQQFTRLAGEGRLAAADLLLPAAGGCPHEVALTPQEQARALSARVLVINGLGLEPFLAKLELAKGATVIDTGRAVGAEERIALPHACAHGCTHGPTYNGHLFASPRQAARIVRFLAGEFARLDPDGAETYRRNAETAGKRLDDLGQAFATRLAPAKGRALVTQHDIFAYLARDSGLVVAGTIQEHPGHDPSARELVELVTRVRTVQVAAICIEPQYPGHVGRTLAAETGAPLITLDPVAGGPADAPVTYYETVMARNLDLLEKTLVGVGK